MQHDPHNTMTNIIDLNVTCRMIIIMTCMRKCVMTCICTITNNKYQYYDEYANNHEVKSVYSSSIIRLPWLLRSIWPAYDPHFLHELHVQNYLHDLHELHDLHLYESFLIYLVEVKNILFIIILYYLKLINPVNWIQLINNYNVETIHKIKMNKI